MRELRRRQIRSVLITLCIFAVLAAAIGILVSPELFGRAESHKDWLVHVAPGTLVESSQHIVVARYEKEAVHEIPNTSLSPNAPTSFTDIYRRFEVVESLKGDFQPGDTIYVGWAVGYTIVNEETGKPEFRSREVPAIFGDADYALFLNWLWSRSRHPDDPQTRIWGTPQGLGVALVDSRGRFSFQTTDYYRAALKDLGFEPVPGSGAPFELTAGGVRGTDGFRERQPPVGKGFPRDATRLSMKGLPSTPTEPQLLLQDGGRRRGICFRAWVVREMTRSN